MNDVYLSYRPCIHTINVFVWMLSLSFLVFLNDPSFASILLFGFTYVQWASFIDFKIARNPVGLITQWKRLYCKYYQSHNRNQWIYWFICLSEESKKKFTLISELKSILRLTGNERLWESFLFRLIKYARTGKGRREKRKLIKKIC